MIRLFKVSIPTAVLALLLSEASLIAACYILAIGFTTDVPLSVFFIDYNGFWKVGIVAAFILMGLYFCDLYDNFRIISRIELFQQYCIVLGAAFLTQAVLSYGRLSDFVLPRWSMIYGSAFALALAPTWRLLYSKIVLHAVGAKRLLFLGASDIAREVIGRISERPELGLQAVGFVDNSPVPEKLATAPRLGSVDDLEKAVAAHKPDTIVVGLTERRGNLPVERLLELRLAGTYVEDAALSYETVFHRVSIRNLRPSHLIFSAELGPSGKSLAVQSFYSFVLALAGLILFSPVMLIVALLVRMTSPGPVLFRQQRVGKSGAPFTIFKFRSMRQDAEAKSGAVWATKDDPRVTSVGRWLRKLRLDELPQLLNVIRGEMAIVGPRPERPEFVAVLQEKMPYYRQRHCVKPGITGWAQINYKYGDTIEDTIIKLEYDLYYIKHVAWSLDAYIMFHTAKTVLFGRGAQ